MKKIIGFLILGVIVGSLAGYTFKHFNGNSTKDVFYDSPEALIQAYFDHLNEGEFDEMVNLAGINYQLEHYDLEEFAERIGAFTYHQNRTLNGGSDYFSKIGRVYYEGQFLSSVWNTILSVEMPDYVENMYQPMLYKDNEDVLDDLIDLMSVDDLSTFELEKIYLLEDASERTLENFEIMAKEKGGDSFYETVAQFEYDGEEYFLGMMLLEIDGKYCINDFSAPYIGLSPMGIAEKFNMEIKDDLKDQHNVIWRK